MHDLSKDHGDYLARGGLGFVLGDGALNPGRERVLEAYYAWAPVAWLRISPDVQCVWNPGYNRDRGPARVFGLRLRILI